MKGRMELAGVECSTRREEKGKELTHSRDGEERDVLDIRIVLGMVGDEMMSVVIL